MQDAGNALKTGRQHGRKGRVAAETGHGLRPETTHNAKSLPDRQGHTRARAHGPQSTAQKAAHRQPGKGNPGLGGQTLLGPIERTHEQQVRARIPPPDFLGHGQGRKDMAAGAPGGQEDFVHESAVLEKFMSRPTQSMVASRLLPP